MTKINPKAMIKSLGTWGKKRSPEILTGIGVAGMVTTTVMAVKVTPKALILIEEEKRRQNQERLEEAKENGEACERIEKLPPKDIVKVTWKCYIPAAVTGAMSILCLVGASSVSARRNAALATAYTLSESAMKEYREKVIETVGEKKEQTVREAVAKTALKKDPVENKQIIVTETNETIFYDPLSGRYFKSSINTLDRIVNELNQQMISSFSSCMSLNSFYYEVGLDRTDVGDILGWRLDGDNNLIELDYIPDRVGDSESLCYYLDFKTKPEYGFDE